MNLSIKRLLFNQDITISDYDRKTATIVNFCCFVIVGDVLFFIFKRLLQGTMTDIVLLNYLVYAFLFSMAYGLQWFRYYILAKWWFFSSFVAILFVMCVFVFPGAEFEYNYIAIPILSLLFFKNKWIHYTSLVIALGLFFLPFYVFKVYSLEDFIPFEKIFLFSLPFAMVNFFKKVNEKNEQKLKEANLTIQAQKENEVAHLQLKSLKAQMNPHFMFNALNSIQDLILTGEKIEAYNYLTKFASLVRENLKHSEEVFIPFEKELAVLRKYIELECLRFDTIFSYEIQTKDVEDDILIPSMIIQPFVENAIKHGLMLKNSNDKTIKIVFELEQVFVCHIIDNGVGFSVDAMEKKKNKTSFSSKAIQNRLELLKEVYSGEIGVFYHEISEGTHVELRLPYKEM